jgi:hypothetical protein
MEKIIELILEFIKNHYNNIINDWLYILAATFVLGLFMNRFYKWHYKELIYTLKTMKDELSAYTSTQKQWIEELDNDKKQIVSENKELSLDLLKLENKLESSEKANSNISTEYKKIKDMVKAHLLFSKVKDYLSEMDLSIKEIEINKYAQVSLIKSLLLRLTTSEKTSDNGVDINELVEQIIDMDNAFEETSGKIRDEEFDLRISTIQSKIEEIMKENSI